MKIKNSTIFTKTELKVLKERFKGSLKDSSGIFSARIRPKIEEMLKIWHPNKILLEKAIEVKK